MRRHPPSARGFTLIELMIVVVVIGFLAAIAVPNFGACRGRRSNTRACFANQKTLAGAIEMYNLDFNTNITRITPELAEQLEAEGYLQQYPRDPGGEGVYLLTAGSGNGVYCTRHGSIQGPQPVGPWKALRNGELEELLRAEGIHDVNWLVRALKHGAERELRQERREGFTSGVLGTLVVGGLGYLFIACFLGAARFVFGDATSESRQVQAVSPEAAGILEVLSVRGVAPPWPPSCPEPEAACPVCATGFQAERSEATGCPRCLAPHHPECREFNQGCGIYACGQR